MSHSKADKVEEDNSLSIPEILADFFLKKIDMSSDSEDSDRKHKSKKKKSKHKKRKHKKSKHRHRSSSSDTSSNKAPGLVKKDVVDDVSSSEEIGIKRLKRIKSLKFQSENNPVVESAISLSAGSNGKDKIELSNSSTNENNLYYGPSLELLISGVEPNKHDLPKDSSKVLDTKNDVPCQSKSDLNLSKNCVVNNGVELLDDNCKTENTKLPDTPRINNLNSESKKSNVLSDTKNDISGNNVNEILDVKIDHSKTDTQTVKTQKKNHSDAQKEIITEKESKTDNLVKEEKSKTLSVKDFSINKQKEKAVDKQKHSRSRSVSRSRSKNDSPKAKCQKRRSRSSSRESYHSAKKKKRQSRSRSREKLRERRKRSHSRSHSRSRFTRVKRTSSSPVQKFRRQTRSRSRSHARHRKQSRSVSKSRKRSSSPSKPRKRSRSLSKPRKQSRSLSKSRKRSRSFSKSRKGSHSPLKQRKRSRSVSKSRKRSRSLSKQRKQSRSVSKSRKRSRSISKSRKQSHSPSKPRKRSKSRKRSRSPSKFSKRSRSKSRKRSRSASRLKKHSRSRSRKRSRSRSRKRLSRSKQRSRSRQRYHSSSRSRPRRHSRSRSRQRPYKRSRSRQRHRSSSRSKERGRSRSKSRNRTKSKKSASRSRSKSKSRRKASPRKKSRSRSKSKDRKSSQSSNKIDQAKILETARKNVLKMMKSGTMPEGLPVENLKKEQLISIQSGGKSVQELTDFCQRLSQKENDPDDADDNEDKADDATGFIHHPFKVKEPGMIKLNIKNAVQLPIKTHAQKIAETTRLSSQFPVSSGNQHKQKELEWIPVVPETTKAVAKPAETTVVSTADANKNATVVANKTVAVPVSNSVTAPPVVETTVDIPIPPLPPPPLPPLSYPCPAPLKAPSVEVSAPMPAMLPPPMPPPLLQQPVQCTTFYQMPPQPEMQTYVTASQPVMMQPFPVPVSAPSTSVFKPPRKLDISSIVTKRFQALTKLQESPNDPEAINTLQEAQESIQEWVQSQQVPGLFTGSTDAKILTAAELCGPFKHYKCRKDMLTHAPPVTEGKGMSLLKKMGWNPGEGLGKNKEGSLEPLVLDIKTDKKGLVSEGENSKKSINSYTKELQGKHPVSALMELCSKRRWKPPLYNCVLDHGPAHKKVFCFKVEVNGVEYQPLNPSPNKKNAKADAAVLCLQSLNVLPKTA